MLRTRPSPPPPELPGCDAVEVLSEATGATEAGA